MGLSVALNAWTPLEALQQMPDATVANKDGLQAVDFVLHLASIWAATGMQSDLPNTPIRRCICQSIGFCNWWNRSFTLHSHRAGALIVSRT